MEMLGWPVSCLPPGYAFNQPFLLAIDFVERISNSHVIKSYTPHNCYGDEVPEVLYKLSEGLKSSSTQLPPRDVLGHFRTFLPDIKIVVECLSVERPKIVFANVPLDLPTEIRLNEVLFNVAMEAPPEDWEAYAFFLAITLLHELAHCKIRFPVELEFNRISVLSLKPSATSPRAFNDICPWSPNRAGTDGESGFVVEHLICGGELGFAQDEDDIPYACFCTSDLLLTFRDQSVNQTYKVDPDWLKLLFNGSALPLQAHPPYLAVQTLHDNSAGGFPSQCNKEAHTWLFSGDPSAGSYGSYAARAKDPRLDMIPQAHLSDVVFVYNSIIERSSLPISPLDSLLSTQTVPSPRKSAIINWLEDLLSCSRIKPDDWRQLLLISIRFVVGVVEDDNGDVVKNHYFREQELMIRYFTELFPSLPKLIRDQLTDWELGLIRERLASKVTCGIRMDWPLLFTVYEFHQDCGFAPSLETQQRGSPIHAPWPDEAELKTNAPVSWFVDNIFQLYEQASQIQSSFATDFMTILPQIPDAAPMSVGITGQTSAGKSTLINRILGYQILPQGNYGSVTAVPAEMHYWGLNQFVVLVHFVSLETWNTILSDAKNEVAGARLQPKKLKREKLNAFRRLDELYFGLEKKNLRLEKDKEADWEKQSIGLLLGTERLSMVNSEYFCCPPTSETSSVSAELKKYTYREARFWPLVAKVDCFGPFELLKQHGFSVCDVPGEGSPYISLNERHAALQRHMDVVFFMPLLAHLFDKTTSLLEQDHILERFGFVVSHRSKIAKDLCLPETTDIRIDDFFAGSRLSRPKSLEESDPLVLDFVKSQANQRTKERKPQRLGGRSRLPILPPTPWFCLENVKLSYVEQQQAHFEKFLIYLRETRLFYLLKNAHNIVQSANVHLAASKTSSPPSSLSFKLTAPRIHDNYYYSQWKAPKSLPPNTATRPANDHYTQLQEMLRYQNLIAAHYRNLLFPPFALAHLNAAYLCATQELSQQALRNLNQMTPPVDIHRILTKYLVAISVPTAYQFALKATQRIILFADSAPDRHFPRPEGGKNCKNRMIENISDWWDRNARHCLEQVSKDLEEEVQECVANAAHFYQEKVTEIINLAMKPTVSITQPVLGLIAENNVMEVAVRKISIVPALGSPVDFLLAPANDVLILNNDFTGQVAVTEIYVGKVKMAIRTPGMAFPSFMSEPHTHSHSEELIEDGTGRQTIFRVRSVKAFCDCMTKILWNVRSQGCRNSFYIPFSVAISLAEWTNQQLSTVI